MEFFFFFFLLFSGLGLNLLLPAAREEEEEEGAREVLLGWRRKEGKGAGSKVWDSTGLLKQRQITFGFPDKVELRLFETFLWDIVDSPV